MRCQHDAFRGLISAKYTLRDQLSAMSNSGKTIDVQDSDRHPADRCCTAEKRPIPAKLIAPSVKPWMEKSHDL